MDKGLAAQVADIAQRVVASGAISANGHGNVSVRVPGAEEMLVHSWPVGTEVGVLVTRVSAMGDPYYG